VALVQGLRSRIFVQERNKLLIGGFFAAFLCAGLWFADGFKEVEYAVPVELSRAAVGVGAPGFVMW
jgi:hypothetical protein